MVRGSRAAVAALAAAAMGLALLATPALSLPSRCGAGELSLAPVEVLAGRPGQLPILIELREGDGAPCTLEGYPRLQLRSATGAVYPFAYRDRGAGDPGHGVDVSPVEPSAAATMAGAASIASAAEHPVCPAQQLTLRAGPPVEPRTQQMPLLLELVNHGSGTCTLEGYPRVGLRSAGGARLPFAYRDGGDGIVTNAPARPVVLAPRATAWVLINKNVCDQHDGHFVRVRGLVLTPPGATSSLSLALGSASPDLEYCAAGIPGHRVDVSPVERSSTATFERD